MAILESFPEKKGLNADDINDIANGSISNGFVQSQFNYSTEETVIGKWIDGKPLYQKTIPCGTLPNNSSIQIPTGISNGVLRGGMCVMNNNTNGAAVIMQRYIGNNDPLLWSVGYFCDAINIQTKTDLTAYTANATIQYTKTTD